MADAITLLAGQTSLTLASCSDKMRGEGNRTEAIFGPLAQQFFDLSHMEVRNTMSDKVLVAYGSKHGATAEIA